MNSPAENLAQALTAAHAVSRDGIVQSSDLTQRHRALLTQAGFLKQACKGWYYETDPTAEEPDAWRSKFAAFLRVYGEVQLKGNYCLSAEGSLAAWTESNISVNHLTMIAPQAGVLTLNLPGDTQLSIYPDALPDRGVKDGLQVMTLPVALARLMPETLKNRVSDVLLGLHLQRRDPGALARALLLRERVPPAERLLWICQAQETLRTFGADVQQQLELLGMKCNPENASALEITHQPVSILREVSEGAVLRLHFLWDKWREQGLAMNLPSDAQRMSPATYQETYKEIATRDAYHSLTIEGFHITKELLEKVSSGDWHPESADKNLKNALTLKGYFLAAKAVRGGVDEVLLGAEASRVVANNVQCWFLTMHSPMIEMGLIKPIDLVGYRTEPVYIRGATHVPPAPYKLPGLMEAFHSRLQEPMPSVLKAAIGHLAFVYIHPFIDGNGRTARFIMNTLLAEGGHPWVVIEHQKRDRYFAALDKASSREDICDFVEFLADHVQEKAQEEESEL